MFRFNSHHQRACHLYFAKVVMFMLFVFLALQPIVVVFSAAPLRALASFSRFLDHTQRRATVVRLLWTSDQSFADNST
jgi:hypothetical protein